MNLSIATPEELQDYREKIAIILRIDAMMLDYIWMDDVDTGMKNRVLYAKRGAAEILRQNLGISIISSVPYESNGWLMFTATGTDKTGRQEIAHGSAYLAGLKGDKLAHSVMTASTRALRRLTMQFVAGGILDETEVQSQKQLESVAAASGAELAGSPTVLPPPAVAPASGPGKDITAVTDAMPLQTRPMGDSVAVAIDFAARHEKNIEKDFAAQQAPPRAGEPGFDMSAHIKKVYEDGAKSLDTFDAGGPPNIHSEIAPKVKKPRKTRNTVSIASPGQQIEMPVGNLDAAGNITPVQHAITKIPDSPETRHAIALKPEPISVPPATAKEPEQGTTGNGLTLTPALTETPIQPVAVPETAQPAAVSPEKAKEYSERLKKYSQDILLKGGMMPSENIGGPTMKLRKFAQVHAGITTAQKMTEEQFEDLLGFLDSYHAKNGATALVEYINKALGAL